MGTPKFVECVLTAVEHGNITVGRVYEVLGVAKGAFYITNDFGIRAWYPKTLLVSAKPTSQPTKWDYAVADELQRKAHTAIDEYNAYIERKPETLYMKLFK